MNFNRPGEFNTLVVSDLHLGEDLSPTATEATRLHVEIVERQLVQFLRHYSRRREDGRPWRLVVNGDLVDFLSISIRPEHPDFLLLAGVVSSDERTHGLHRTAKSAVAAIEAVAARHVEVFRWMARFLARGNRIEIICGNHDAELTWPAPQAALRNAVSAAWESVPDSRRPGAPTGAELALSLGFHPWFFWEPGCLWIEHGHQYDECCSFEHQLDPRRPGGEEVAMNVDGAGARYIQNRVRDTGPTQDSWSALGYLRFGAGLGVRGGLGLVAAYLRFMAAMIGAWRATRASRRSRDHRRDVHRNRLEQLATDWQIDQETLRSVDRLRRLPVARHLRKLASVLMLDLLVVYGAGALIALLALCTLAMPYSAAVAAGALVVAAVTVRVMTKDRSVDPSTTMELAGEAILDRVDASYVVFGHTHEPVARTLGNEGRAYFNTGTWVPSGRPGILRAFTHLVVKHRDSGPIAELCQWRDGLSRAFTPGWRPERVRRPLGASVAAPAASTTAAARVTAIPAAATAGAGAGTPGSARAAARAE